jgi:hypothetical protein
LVLERLVERKVLRVVAAGLEMSSEFSGYDRF